MSISSEPSFSTCWHNETFKIPAISGVFTVLHQLPATSDTVWKELLQNLRSYNMAFTRASMTSKWANKPQDSSNFVGKWLCERYNYHHMGASFPPLQVTYFYSSMFAQNRDKVGKATGRGSNVRQQLDHVFRLILDQWLLRLIRMLRHLKFHMNRRCKTVQIFIQ